MRDYARIATKIRSTPWLITEEGLRVILSIFEDRLANGRLSDEELENRLGEISLRGGSDRNSNGPNYEIVNGIGILPLMGPIFGKANLMTMLSGATSLEQFSSDLESMLSDPQVSSIIMQIDSPGGSSDLVKETGDRIFAGRDVKPIYASVDTMCGSAALWLASQATKMYSTPSGSVGSLGAYTVHEDQSVADAQQGKKYTFISAGPFKTEGNPHEALSAEGKDYRQGMIDELYNEFVNNVARGRNSTSENVIANYGGGRMLSANKALEVGMIDGIVSFDGLVNHLATQPRQISVQLDGKQIAAIRADDTLCGISDDNIINLTGKLVGNKLEVADWEHSEPGTGTPPAPRQQDPPTDPAIAGGWRREPLPLEPDDPNAPQASNTTKKGRLKMDEERLNALMALFGVDTEEALITAINAMHAQSAELREAVANANQVAAFSEQFPDIFKEHQSMIEDGRKTKATNFASSVATIKKAEGEKFVDTKFGLSTLAKDIIEETHLKFANGTASVDDFEKCITTIMHGGTLEYGERGSSLETEKLDFDTTTAQGIANARNMFAAKVAEIQVSDNLTYDAALSLAAQKFPDLAQAYRAALPG